MKSTLILLILVWTSAVMAAADCFYCPPNFFFGAPISVPEWPIEYVNIRKVEYETNPHATYCKRPMEIVDTIVLHHSESPSTTTAEDINRYHLSRGTPTDPWYMIAYSYVLNSPYAGGTRPPTQISAGRPLEIVGAHAGSNVFIPTTPEQKKLFDEGKVTCGREGEEFKVDPTLMKDGRLKANVTTIGLVVIGNYAPFSKTNPNGYSKKNPRYPTKTTQDQIARMACQLQKKYPNMKSIKWHSYYHSTSCPGTIKDYVGQIKTLARNYGCEFN